MIFLTRKQQGLFNFSHILFANFLTFSYWNSISKILFYFIVFSDIIFDFVNIQIKNLYKQIYTKSSKKSLKQIKHLKIQKWI